MLLKISYVLMPQDGGSKEHLTTNWIAVNVEPQWKIKYTRLYDVTLHTILIFMAWPYCKLWRPCWWSYSSSGMLSSVDRQQFLTCRRTAMPVYRLTPTMKALHTFCRRQLFVSSLRKTWHLQQKPCLCSPWNVRLNVRVVTGLTAAVDPVPCAYCIDLQLLMENLTCQFCVQTNLNILQEIWKTIIDVNKI